MPETVFLSCDWFGRQVDPIWVQLEGSNRLYGHYRQITAHFVETMDSIYGMESVDYFALDCMVSGSNTSALTL